MTWKEFLLSIIASIIGTVLYERALKGLVSVRTKSFEAPGRSFEIRVGHPATTAFTFILALGLVFVYPGTKVLAPSDPFSNLEMDSRALEALNLSGVDVKSIIAEEPFDEDEFAKGLADGTIIIISPVR